MELGINTTGIPVEAGISDIAWVYIIIGAIYLIKTIIQYSFLISKGSLKGNQSKSTFLILVVIDLIFVMVYVGSFFLLRTII